MKKGFTLMEILAVLLIIAVIVSAAVPVFRAIRYDVKNAQAKTAAKKLAEAVRSYYQASKGSPVTKGCFSPSSSWYSTISSTSCTAPNTSGVPNQSIGTSLAESAVSQLFACGFLTLKDFAGSPYKYCVCNPNVSVSIGDCAVGEKVFVTAYGQSADAAGKKYFTTTFDDGHKYRMWVDANMQVKDNAD